jgi:hypothetical protein
VITSRDRSFDRNEQYRVILEHHQASAACTQRGDPNRIGAQLHTGQASFLCLSATFLADEPTPRAIDENMPIAVVAAVVITNFPVHPRRQVVVFVGVGRDFVFGHEI